MGFIVNHQPADAVFLRTIFGNTVHSIILGIAAKLGFNPCQNFHRFKRLCNVVVCSQCKTHNYILISYLCRQHNNRKYILFTKLLAKKKSICIRKHNIQKQKIRYYCFQLILKICSIIKFVNLVSVITQINFQKIRYLFFIIHDHNDFFHDCPLICIHNTESK